jgi:hypothetical protein
MRFDNDGITLWYGTPDTPAPPDRVGVPPGNPANVSITVGVQPPSASNAVVIRFSVNGGATQEVKASLLHHDVAQKSQYFLARFPALEAGDQVAYTPICRCPGKQAPAANQADTFVGSFQVVSEAHGLPIAAKLMPHTMSRVPGASVEALRPAAVREVAGEAVGKAAGEIPVPPVVHAVNPGAVQASAIGSASAPAPGISGAPSTVANPAAGLVNQPSRASAGQSPAATVAGATAGLAGAIAGQGIGAILSIAGLSDSQQQTVLSLSAANTQTTDVFWRSLRANPDFQQAGLVDKLQSTLQLGLLTQNHVPMIQQLQQINLKTPSDLLSLDVPAWISLINKPVNGQPVGVPPGVPGGSPGERTLNYAVAMAATLQASFPTAGMARIAAKTPSLPMRVGVSQFFTNATDFDIRTHRVDSYVALRGDTIFQGIAESDRPAVVEQVKRLQRVFQLSTSADSAAALLAAGLDSAHAIAKMPRNSFLAQHSVTLGGEAAAADVYERAKHINARTLLVYSHINETLNGFAPAGIAAPGDSEQFKKECIKRLPNYEELFGSLDLCQCADCRSVLSPAAYLVDLFQFLRHSTPNEVGQTPLDLLFNRRPDLPFLPLTCENTNTPLPYIDLVNEVLEAYVASGKLDPSIAYDTGDTAAAVLLASPQNTNNAAYARLAQAVYPATLPFNQPVAAIRVYLDNLGTSRYEVLKAFQKQNSATPLSGVNAEYLGITREEFQILTKSDFDPGGPVTGALLYAYYGWTTPPALPDTWEFETARAPVFLKRTGISFANLDQLIEAAFVNPGFPQGDALTQFRKIPISFALLAQLVQSNFANPDPAVVTAVTNAMGSWKALTDWAAAWYQTYARIIVLDSPDGNCAVENVRLIHLDGSPLTDAEFDKLHRFIRLWRKLGWSIADVDCALAVLGKSDITADLINGLSGVAQLQDALRVPDLQILFSLWGPIITRGADALYGQLFLRKATLDPAFLPAPDGSVLPGTETIHDHVPALVAALRVSVADLDAIRADAGLTDDNNTPPTGPKLTLENVSKLYRYAVLAQALRLRVGDLLGLKALYGADPFAGPQQTLDFYALASSVQQSGFKVAQLSYLYRHLSPPPADLSPPHARVLALAQALRRGLTQIARDNVQAPDPAGELTRAKLMALFDTETAEQAAGMINGSFIYSTPLSVLPAGIVFPDLVRQKASFDAATQALRFQGAMTDAERAALAGAAPVSATAYQGAVADLYQQPATFVENALSGFLDVTQASTRLLRTIPSLDSNLAPVELDASGNVTTDPSQAATTAMAAKFEWLLTQLLPYLTDQLSHALAKQTAADALRLDTAAASALLECALVSASDPTQPAVKDLLALASGGLSASYFGNDNLTGPPAATASPADTGIPAGIQSARWDGMLQAPNGGTYTLSVASNGTPQLWIDAVQRPLTKDPQTGAWKAAPLPLTAGKIYDLRLEVASLPATGGMVEVQWQSASRPRIRIPVESLFARAQLNQFAATFTRAQKAALIVSRFQLRAPEIEYLQQHGSAFSGLDFNSLPLQRDAASAAAIDAQAPSLFGGWQRLNGYRVLRDAIPQGQITLLDVFGAGTLDQAQANLAAATGWDAQAIAGMAGPAGFALTAADFTNEVALVRIQVGINLMKRLGVSAPQLFNWADLNTSFADFQTRIAPAVVKTVQGKYDPETWLSVARSLNDKMRQSQRDALVACLLPALGLDSANQLFEVFLIDAEMGPCMQTSRIKQAISSVQLFIQRCLLNLESATDPNTGKQVGIKPSDIDLDQWSWMQQYTVWAANREVFLYPENWIDGALRDDKSTFFRTLESALLQNEVRSDTVEDAYRAYLQSLDDVARLEICGEYWEVWDPATGEIVNTFHVFGRQRQDPKAYFYRQLHAGIWSPWEPITSDIQFDHIIPIVWNRRLVLFWPTFSRVSDPPGQFDPQNPKPVDQQTHIQIGLSFSVYKDGKWSPKHVASQLQQLQGPDDQNYEDPRLCQHYGFVFRTEIRTDARGLPSDLFIHAFYCGPEEPAACGSWKISGCGGDTVLAVNVTPGTGWAWDSPRPTGTLFNSMMYRGTGYTPDPEMTMVGQDGKTPIKFLNQTGWPYDILYPHQGGFFVLKLPFFYQDDARTFFAIPSVAWLFQGIANANAVDLTQYAHLLESVVSSDLAVRSASSAARVSLPGAPLPAVAGATRVMMRGISARPAPAPPANGPAGTLAPRAPATLGRNLPVAPASAVAPLNFVNWSAIATAHDYAWSGAAVNFGFFIQTTDLTFVNHYHPFVCEFIRALTRGGIPALLTEANQTLGNPYLHSPWQLAFWPNAAQGWVTAIAEGVSGPAAILQSDFGFVPNFNFEAAVLQGNNLIHYWKDNSIFGFSTPWQPALVAGSPEIITTKASGRASLIQSDYYANDHGRFDLVVPEGSNLVHYWSDNTAPQSPWRGGEIITAQSTGPGCIMQSDYLAGGNGRFEVLALEGTNLVHYIQQGGAWQRAEVITSKARSAGCMIQSDFLDVTDHRYLEVVVCEGDDPVPPFRLMHYTFNGSAWLPGELITANATDEASIIRSNISDGWHGNLEVVVPEGNLLVHYWRDNSTPFSPWWQGQVITPRATGSACLIQSSFGSSGYYLGNFEVAALENGRVAHYWFDNSYRFLFTENYRPTYNVLNPFPGEYVDFSFGGAYSLYNWELFFYVPLLIATRLSANQRYQDALSWFHYILNPTDDALNEAPPGRYWKFVPLKYLPREQITEMFVRLDKGDPLLIAQVEDWRDHPFEPFRIARLRWSAFQKHVFMKYLDAVFGCGDQLFRQNTIESINRAEQFYIMGSNLLGAFPETLPPRGKPPAMSYNDLIQSGGQLDAFSNALVTLENEFPFSSGVTADPASQSGGLLGVSATLFFCIPQNAQMLKYWSIAEDRLFKIRNCMNIQGVVEQLPLFEPPIDPGLLVQAVAKGVDLGSVLNDINAPLPYYRFTYTLQKALELCSECRTFGAALLSAIEKGDAEALAGLRAGQEAQVQDLMEQVKKLQVTDLQDQAVALQKSRDNAALRYQYYQLLLTGSSGAVPAIGASVPQPAVPSQPTSASGGSLLLQEEQKELESSHSARDWQVRSSTSETLAGIMHFIPDFAICVLPIGVGMEIVTGGTAWGLSLGAVARYQNNLSAQDSYDASHSEKMAKYFRRQQEWQNASNSAAGEIMQIDQQIAAATTRVELATYELNTVYPKLRQNAHDVQDFLAAKYTSQDLYAWMTSELSTTYFQSYQLAYDLAKRAERAFRFELGVNDTRFIQFGYWDSLRKGLQAGERLYLALRQMERAYQDQNKREYEITKRVSLLLLDPIALISLKENGSCTVELTEALFDADYDHHYMRRLRNVSVTVPCVTGPYTSVNCTLTLLKNKVRFDPDTRSGYEEQDNDPRFVYNFAATQSIATSTAQNDSGMFEVNFRDERYLPFEYAGAISTWRIDLPQSSNAFDVDSVSDVIMNVSLTAREGGDPFARAVRKAMAVAVPGESTRLFSLSHEFPTEWYKFLQPPAGAAAQTMEFEVSQERFPFLYRGCTIAVDTVDVFLLFRTVYDADTFKLDPKLPTPQGDYAKSASPLTLHVTAVGASTPVDLPLKTDPAYRGVPHASVSLDSPGTPGKWLIEATDADIQVLPPSLQTSVDDGGSHFRLKASLIRDILLVVSYTAS